MFLNHYHCGDCDVSWSDTSDSTNDDRCPDCRTPYTPEKSVDLEALDVRPAAAAPRFRIRRCDGSKQAWLLVALNADGGESTSYGSYVTALSIDSLLNHPHGRHLRPAAGSPLELIL